MRASKWLWLAIWNFWFNENKFKKIHFVSQYYEELGASFLNLIFNIFETSRRAQHRQDSEKSARSKVRCSLAWSFRNLGQVKHDNSTTGGSCIEQEQPWGKSIVGKYRALIATEEYDPFSVFFRVRLWSDTVLLR